MPKTQLQTSGYGGRRYGSFAGKSAVADRSPYFVRSQYVFSSGVLIGSAWQPGLAKGLVNQPGAVCGKAEE